MLATFSDDIVFHTDWIVTPGDSQDPEANTLLMWEKQLKEFMRNRFLSLSP